MRILHLLLFLALSVQAAQDIISNGTNSITRAEYVRSLRGALDGPDALEVGTRILNVGTNVVPVLVELLTDNDSFLLSSGYEELLRLAPERLRAMHDELLRQIREGHPGRWGALRVLPAIAQPGDERVVAELLYRVDAHSLGFVTDVLVSLGTPDALAELEKAFPILAKEAKPLPPERTLQEANRALNNKPVSHSGEVVRVYEPYMRGLSNRIVTLRQKLEAASNQTTTTLGGEKLRTSVLTGPRATGLPGSDPAGQAASADSASRRIRFALPVALLALAAVVFWLIRRPRKS